MKTGKININLEEDGLVSLTQVFELDKSTSADLKKIIEKRNELGKEITVKLKDLGLVSASDEATTSIN